MPHHVMSCHTMPYHTIAYYTILCYTMPYHSRWCHVMPHHVMSCHATPYPTIPYHTIPHDTMPCHTRPCYAMPPHIIHTIQCYVILCRAMSYYAMPYYDMPCHVMPYYIIPYHLVPLFTKKTDIVLFKFLEVYKLYREDIDIPWQVMNLNTRRMHASTHARKNWQPTSYMYINTVLSMYDCTKSTLLVLRRIPKSSVIKYYPNFFWNFCTIIFVNTNMCQ